jgi:hypothetical protein
MSGYSAVRHTTRGSVVDVPALTQADLKTGLPEERSQEQTPSFIIFLLLTIHSVHL